MLQILLVYKEIDLLTGNVSAMGIIETIKLIEREEGREQGLGQGNEQKSYEFVQNLLLHTDFDIHKIASLVGVSVDFVLNVQETLGKK